MGHFSQYFVTDADLSKIRLPTLFQLEIEINGKGEEKKGFIITCESWKGDGQGNA